MADEPKAPSSGTSSTTSSSTAASSAAPQITFSQFTESTMGAVLRAVDAEGLPHQPIIIGLIWHPGLGGLGTGGTGGYGTTPSCGFAATVQPFFTDCYHDHMLAQGLDLWDAATVQSNWTSIYNIVNSGQMPAPGCPGTFDKAAFLTAFQCWKTQGFPP